MNIAILELPAEGAFKVKLNEVDIAGRIVPGEHDKSIFRISLTDDGHLRDHAYHTKEGAACTLVLHHVETERKHLKKQAAKQEKANEKTRDREPTTPEQV